MRLVIALAVVAGCDRRPITSCMQDLTGEYVDGDRHWMVTDRGDSLDIYPVFDDVPRVAGLEIAPRVIELDREDALRGVTRRRYMQGAKICTAHVPATITRCEANTLEIVHAETAPPLGFAPCQWGRTEPARVERWTRR